MENNKDMNLWDLCAKTVQALINIIKACGRFLAEMLRVIYRRWWVVGIVMLVAIVCALYYSRTDNLRYEVNAVVYLNGPSAQDVERAYLALNSNLHREGYTRQYVGETLGLTPAEAHRLCRFETFRVIDNLNDGTADYIDWSHSNNGTDTLRVQMRDRLVLQFECRNLAAVENIEKGIMAYLNGKQQFIDEYSAYKAHKERQLFFDQMQIEKLDTLTSRMYSQAGHPQIQSSTWDLTMGKQEITLPIEDIEEYFDRKLLRDRRYMLCSAPVTLQDRFIADGNPINNRRKVLAIAIVAALILGSGLGYAIENFKRFMTFLKKRD